MSITSNIKKEQGVNNLKQAGRNFQDAGESAAREIGNDLIERATHAGEEVRRYVSTAADRVSQVGSDVETAINAKPVQSTAVALLAGFVLGLLIRR